MIVEYDLTLSELPLDCITDCSHPGDVGEEVSNWRKGLDFNVNRTKAVEYLINSGGWEMAELNSLSDNEIAEKILWLACCTFYEFIEECERKDIDPLNVPDDFEPRFGSDIFILE